MTNLEQAIENLKANTHSWKVEVSTNAVSLLSKEDGKMVAILIRGLIMTYRPLSFGSDFLTLINEVLKAQKEVK